MNEFHELLIPGEYYHIYNRAVGKEKLFLKHDNYLFFLSKCEKYLPPICDTFSYCLIPNHFHLFLRMKDRAMLEKSYFLMKGKQISLFDSQIANEFLVGQISNLCSGYVKAFNKVYSRKGRLLIDPFSRKIVKSDGHFNSVVPYIHGNAVHHGLCKSLEEWPYTSYHQFVGENSQIQLPFRVRCDEVLSWYGGIDNLKFVIREQPIRTRTKTSKDKTTSGFLRAVS